MIFFFQGVNNLVILVLVNNTIEYDEFKFNERHDSIISAVRSFAVKLAGGVNQGLSTLVLIISGIYAISQKISSMEIDADTGIMTKEEVLSKADNYLASVESWQPLVLRLGMVLIPIATILWAYFMIRRKYNLDEARYDEIVQALNSRKSQ